MSRTCGNDVSEHVCYHSNTVDDERDGTNVCTDCGLVLDTLLFPTSTANPRTNEGDENYKIKYFIKDVCANAHIPESICNYSYFFYKKIRKDEVLKKIKNNQLAAFAIYNTLHRFEVPRSLEEISHYTGENIKRVLTIEAEATLTENRNDPTHFVDRFCSLLQLEYFDSNIIKSIVGNMYGMGNVKTSCLIATCIHLFCREKKRKIMLKTICAVCSVSPTSVHRIMKCLDKKYVKQITLLCSK
jgi:transcription initiation factor TFIIIB Brf1 subunit/transcription initiation factor TFIIB